MSPLAHYDVAIAGLGAFGSAAAYHLARGGLRVLGLDRHTPPHVFGSSHGGSRIIRQAYYEGEQYVPLLRRSYALWRALEAEAGVELMTLDGGLMIGPGQSDLLAGARRTAEAYAIPHEMLDARAVRTRFPAFRPPAGHVALFEPGAGFLRPEACIRAHLRLAQEYGADLRFDDTVTTWEASADGVTVKTERGTFAAGHLVLTAGGWIEDLLDVPGMRFTVERQVNGWFASGRSDPSFQPSACPIYMWEYEPGLLLYGFPDAGDGVKAGLHHGGEEVTHPAEIRRDVMAEDVEALRRPLLRLMPRLRAEPLRTATCLYTNTPDYRYVVGRHPEHPRVVVAGGGSGHGFKASAAIGEAVCEVVEGRATTVDLGAFRMGRGS